MEEFLVCAMVVAFGTTGYWFSRVWVTAHNKEEAKFKRINQLERNGEKVKAVWINMENIKE